MSQAKFIKRLIELREENNLSQEKLAKLIHVSQSTIAKWEAGDRKPNIDFLELLSDAFHVTTDYMLGRTEYRD